MPLIHVLLYIGYFINTILFNEIFTIFTPFFLPFLLQLLHFGNYEFICVIHKTLATDTFYNYTL